MDPRCHCKFGGWWPNRTMGDVEVSESPYGSRYGVNMAGWAYLANTLGLFGSLVPVCVRVCHTKWHQNALLHLFLLICMCVCVWDTVINESTDAYRQALELWQINSKYQSIFLCRTHSRHAQRFFAGNWSWQRHLFSLLKSTAFDS